MISLLDHGADPFQAGFDPLASDPSNSYIFGPFYYVAEKGEFRDKDKDAIIATLEAKGLRPSTFAVASFPQYFQNGDPSGSVCSW